MVRRTRGVSVGMGSFAALALLSWGRPAHGESQPESQRQTGACPEGDLLRGASPIEARFVDRDLALLTDGRIAREGAGVLSETAVLLASGSARVTYDLGRDAALDAVVLQGTGDTFFVVYGSSDGQAFEPLGEVSAPGQGLRTAVLALGGRIVRYLRVGDPIGTGAGASALAEIGAYCAVGGGREWLPADAPQGPPARRPLSSRVRQYLPLAAALLGLLFVQLVRMARMGPWPGRGLVAVAALAAVGWIAVEGRGASNHWDSFHYYVGAKYHAELGYQRF